jgi:hypothetical protein
VSLVLAGCPAEEEAPPLFNAKDLSVQCGTGQVGWDFSTGGNDTSVVENSVSREITIDRAMLGNCNYQTDFATDCDGKRDCTRLVKKPSSPACAGGALDLVYRCGSEPHKYNVVVPGDAGGQTVTLACGEPMAIVSAVYGSNAPSAANQANITTAVASACTGKRRCSLDDPYVLNNRGDPWPNNHKDTLIRYFCGTDPVVKETTVPSGQRVDIQCPLTEAAAPKFNDTMRIQSVTLPEETCSASPSYCSNASRKARLAAWDKKIRESCDGKKNCRLKMDPYVRGNGDYIPITINYWCTSPQAPESRSIYSHSIYEQQADLYCGTPLRIVGATGNGADLEAARAACDYKSRCVLPQMKVIPGVGRRQAQYQYTCGDNAFDVRRSRDFYGDSIFSSSANAWRVTQFDQMERQIECDRYSNALIGGIRIVSADIEGGIIKATNECYGRATCFIQTNNSSNSITYRCGSSYEVKTATRKSILPAGLQLSCRPDVKVVSLTCDPTFNEGETRCVTATQPYRYMDTAPADLCRVGNNGVCDIGKRKDHVAHLKWTCGNDPTVYSYDGSGEPEPLGPAAGQTSAYDFLRPRCEVPEKPYVEKACVPEVCPGTMRRDSKLNCVPDATKVVTEVFTAPILKEWAAGPDGGTAQWGGAETSTLTEDFPYQLYGYTQYRAAGGVQLPPTTGVTLWAFDEFTANTDAGVASSKQTTYGFRCVLAEAPLRDAEYPPVTAGYRLVVNGGKGGVLPTSCFRQDVDDGRNAWSDGARRVGVPESEFRRKYSRKTSWVISSFDAQGRTVARKTNNVLQNAVNPIGFFYNSNNGWIDQLGFYSQTMDLRFAKKVTFVESTELQLNAISTVLRQAQINLDVSQPTALPSFDVDFTWSQRGDSPAKNPLSPKSLLSANAATPLNRRNLKATIELARLSSSEPEWVSVNATSFPSVGLGNGNAMQQTVRLSANVTPSLRERMLSVKGTDTSQLQTSDGFMRGFEEDTTLFRVRVCMDFDEVTHALGSTNAPSSTLDNKGVTAQRDGTTYSLKFVKRCAEGAPLLLSRELFVYPTAPVATVEKSGDSASSPRQGDSASGSTNDMGNQAGCTENAAGKQTCTGQSRNNMTTSGQFSLSAIESSSNDETTQDETTKTTKLSSEMKLFGFKVFDLSGGGAGSEPQSPGAWEVNIELSPNLDKIADAWKSRRTAGIKTSADKVKTKPKSKKKKSGLGLLASKFERDGLATKLGKEFPFTLGPFPFVLEVSFSVGFGFGATLKIGGDYQSTTSMANPKYPCLKTTAGDCVIAYPDAKSFDDAIAECRYKGGTLAEVRNATDLSAVTSAISSVGGTTSQFWLGGQAAYQYADPRCNSTRDNRCAGISRTRYAWLTGNVPFATQVRQEPALINPASMLANHGFGNNLGNLISRVPDQAGVLIKKDTGRLETAVTTTTAPFVCSFDPASSYVEAKMGVEVKVEFSMGFGAKICTPSSDIGFCLGVTVNLITAGVNVSAERSRLLVFNNSKIKVSLLGQSTIEGTWEVAFMSGAFSAELNFLFFSTSWEIASYGGLYTIEGDLFPAIVSPYARTFP